MKRSFPNPLFAFFLLLVVGCNQSKNEATKETVTDSPAQKNMQAMQHDSVKKINIAESDLADKKDPVCGMPAFRYMQDTAVFSNRIYGFCSKECKDEFLKNPAAYIVKEEKKTAK